jgi:hypothetical protein
MDMFRIIKYYLYNFYLMILYNAVLNWNNFSHETSAVLKLLLFCYLEKPFDKMFMCRPSRFCCVLTILALDSDRG